MNSLRALTATGVCVALGLGGTGCISKSSSRKAAREAFQAGQARAARTAEAERNNIKVSGPVLVPIVEWREGLTLAEAIVAAHWNAQGEPQTVVITRQGERVQLSPSESLAAAQLPLEPGDQIELLP
ncbi:MAG: hypothetical protein RLY20_781 [Verrucomicrobiota bacterium]